MKLYRYVALLFAIGAAGLVNAQTFTEVSLYSPTYVSGPTTTGTSTGRPLPGSVYKYTNVGRNFANSNTIDAYVTFVKTSNTSSDLVGVHTLDVPASVNSPGGYDSAFQPVTSCSYKSGSYGIWARGNCNGNSVQMTYSANQNYLCHFRISFKKGGTQIDTALNVRASFIDIDGFGSGTEAEQNAFMPGISYALAPSTTLTISQRPDKLYNALGRPANVGGISLTAITAITQIVYLNRTYIDFGIGMQTKDANGAGGCYDAVAGGRLASVSFSEQPSGLTVIKYTTDTIRGTVWDDANNSGTASWTLIRDGAEAGTAGGGMYVYALDANTGTIVCKAAVAADGTYRIVVPGDLPIRLVLSAENVAEGVTNVTLAGTVNTGWVATTPQQRPSFMPTGNMNSVDWGVEQTPVVNPYTVARQLNPGGALRVPVPAAAFTGSDPEDGTYPAGLNGRTVRIWPAVNGDVYYNGVKVTAAASYSSFNPVLVTVDPLGGTVSTITTTFDYSTYDAGSQIAIQKTVTLPFEAPITISGAVWDDANVDAVKGTAEAFTDAGGLYAVLTSSAGAVLQVQPVNAATGAYSFDQAISGTTYQVILSATAPSVGSNLTASSLPSPATGAWIHTGTNIAGTASLSNKTGIISVTTGALGSAALTNRNFGIEQLPLAGSVTAAARPNPGDTLSVLVAPATFTGSDNDGVIPNIRITAFPANTTSIQVGTTRYYATTAAVPAGNCPAASCVVFPAAGITVAADPARPGQPSTAIRVDPVNGSNVVSIPFKTIDNGGQESTNPGSANLPFTDPLPPVAQNIDNDPINSSATYTHIGGFVASDPQGDPILSYKVLSLPPANTGILYTCSSNTVPCTGTYTAVALNQVLTPVQSQNLHFDPDSSFIGTATFTYSATSKNGTSNTAIETIPVVNNPPTANSFTTAPVKRNSSNNPLPPLGGSDGDGIVVSYTVTPPAPEQGTLTYCTAPPSTGCGTNITTAVTLTPEQVKRLSYTPATDFTGIATFTYTTKDNNNLVSETATVSVPVTNLGFDPRQLPPVTQNITLAPLNSASPAVRISELLGTDPDGTIVSYKILSLPNSAIGKLYACSNGTYPCTGTLSAVAVNQVLTPAQAATLQFAPTAGNNATPATFRYNATDNDGLLSNTSTYTIPVMNQPPTAVAIQTRVPFNAVNYPVPALQGTDDDGSVTTYRILSVPNATTEGTLYTCSSNTVPCTGSYAPVAANANLSPAQIASLTFTPVSGFIGTATASYAVIDNNQKQSNTAPITLKVDNLYLKGRPPVAVGSTYNMGANDGTALLPVSFISATDPDGTIASFTITSLPPVSQGRYTYCTTPPSTDCGNAPAIGQVLTPDQAKALRFTPEPTYSGPSYLGFFATDNDGNLSNLAVSVVNVTSKPPIASGYTTASVKSGGSPIGTPLLATDYLDNGTVVRYTVISIPNPADGSLSYCSNPPSAGCNTPVTVGAKLSPAQAATLRFTPGAKIAVHEVIFNFTATDNSNNLSNVASIVVPVFDPVLCIKVRAYLEGALVNNNDESAPDGRPLMRDNLRSSPFTDKNYLPSSDPYEFPTSYVNVADQYVKYPPQNADWPVFQQVMDPSVFRAVGQDAIVDWAFVELRNKANNAEVLATRAGLMQRDGDIVDVDGTGCLLFPGTPVDSYYVAVRHRTHLGTMTKYGQSVTNLQNLVDLSVPTTPLYDKGIVSGFNFSGLSQKSNFIGTYRAMWQGDFDGNGKIKYDNPDDDLAVMLFGVRRHLENTTRATNFDFAYGYMQGDFDMNSKTKYDNPDDDNAMLLFQVRRYPLNTTRATNFDFVLQQLP